ncbi:MAG: rhodanese-like domain-containing protein [Bacteroidetes bacterium]|nr:rhodanese-like domain-containing protein [Bacteroidota bacterium]
MNQTSGLWHVLYGSALNRFLAIAAVVLGLVSLAGTTQSNEKVTIDARELALIVENEVDHVTVQKLADDLIRGETNFRLLDLQTPEDFAAYHLPGAENVQLNDLAEYPIQRNERIVLYSGGGIHSAQAWFLLKARGYKAVYMVLGGLSSWKEEVLYPTLAADATPEQVAGFAEVEQVAKHFGGAARRGGAAAGSVDTALPTPPVIAPTAPVIQRPTKRAREGC